MTLTKVSRALLFATIVLPTGCRQDATLAPNDEALINYGYGPRSDRHVRYQPDVIAIGGGPRAIRAVSTNNLTWTIDGRAEHARELSVGKIMFASSRAVGRVVAIEHRGRDLAVTVVPVSFTEVISDADLTIDQPVRPDEMVFHESNPVTTANLRSSIDGGVLEPAVWRGPARPPLLRLIGATRKMTAKFKLGSWEIEPYYKFKGVSGTNDDDIGASYLDPRQAGDQTTPSIEGWQRSGEPQAREESRASDLGLRVQYIAGGGKWQFESGAKVSNGLKFGGSVRLSGENIRVRSHIAVVNGQMQRPSTFVIDGIDRLHIGLVGGVDRGVDDNVKTRIEVPAEFSKQIPPELTNGIPLAIQVKFKFIVETAFSGGNSTLWTHGDYRMSGRIGYDNGAPVSPTFQVEHPMMNDLHGIAIGVSGMVIAVEFRWLVGFGTEVAMAGPYGKLIFAGGVTKGSILAFGLGSLRGGPTCRSATLKGDLGLGVGVLVDTSWLADVKKLAGDKWKKTELELFESSFTFLNEGWFAPDIPLCRASAS